MTGGRWLAHVVFGLPLLPNMTLDGLWLVFRKVERTAEHLPWMKRMTLRVVANRDVPVLRVRLFVHDGSTLNATDRSVRRTLRICCVLPRTSGAASGELRISPQGTPVL